MSTYPEAIPTLEQRIERLREFEREYNGRLRAYFTQKLGELNGTGDVLGAEQRRQAEHARDCLATWELSCGPDSPYMDRETVLADQVRALLAVVDALAPKEDGQ